MYSYFCQNRLRTAPLPWVEFPQTSLARGVLLTEIISISQTLSPLANIEHQPPFWSLLFPPKFLGFPKLSHMGIKSRPCGLLTATATFVEYCYSCHSLRFSSLRKSPPEPLLTTHWTPLHSLSLRPHHGCTKNTHKFFGRTNGKVSYYFFSVRAYI